MTEKADKNGLGINLAVLHSSSTPVVIVPSELTFIESIGPSTSTRMSSRASLPSTSGSSRAAKDSKKSSPDKGGSAPKRKRENLSHMSEAEKRERRKMRNRIAAQKARDQKCAVMKRLERTLEKQRREVSS